MSDLEIPGYEVGERIHESSPRVVHRGRRTSDGESVVLKTLLAPYPRKQDVAELRREYLLTRRLAVEGVVRVHELVAYGSGNVAIVMEPFGVSLAELLARRGGRPLPAAELLPIAARLARILGRVHERDVVHKDVVPRNVLYDPVTGELRLIDFGIASELSRERQAANLSKRLEGSLPYISPEQTGRMNRDLDYRSDLYSLGVTLFELLTGTLPFQAEGALEWVHCHISRNAPSAHEVLPDVPETLSRIVLKLMAKDAEDRYQSTFGLVADLERCREELERAGAVSAFPLGAADVPRKFQVPQHLYGRETELAKLRVLFDDAAHAANVLTLVSGWSGVGKSSLVNELAKSIVRERGCLLVGKFDQFRQNEAYGAIGRAVRGLVQEILGEPEERLAAWREALRRALGANARLVADLVPEIELIVGAQPPVPELPSTEARNRFQIVLVNFLKAIARDGRPLVLFLDDLQWADAPTLDLIARLVTARELSHFLFIGAYRSNAVDAGHPLVVALNEIRKAREIVELVVEPLDRDAALRLTADAVHADVERARPLGDLVYEKARGNPFFLTELLKTLHEQGAIAFDQEAGRWGWDLEAVRRADVADNVVEFMVANLRRLPEATQRVLRLAACVGNTFDLATLSVIDERPMPETAAALDEALRRTLVVPLTESYTLAGLPSADAFDSTYKFQHDRVQQAAYALIDDDRKQAVHLSIGRRIRGRRGGADLGERLMEVVAHLNAGRERIKDATERRDLARLNLEAGRKAERSAALAAALGLLRVGRELLPEDSWTGDPDLTRDLAAAYQRCAYLTGDTDEAQRCAEDLIAHARGRLEKAQVLAALTRQYATTGKMRESIRAALAGLALLGVNLVDAPDDAAVARERAEVERNLAGRRVEDLVDAPELTNPEAKAAIALLMEVFAAAFLSGSGRLFPYLVLKFVNLSLRRGNSPESAFAYAAYGMLLCGVLDEPSVGYEYGKLAVAMNERYGDLALKARILYVHAMFIHHWSNHWSSMTPWFKKVIEAGYQSGDLLYLAYGAQDCVIWDPKLDLETAAREQRTYLAIVADTKYQDSLDSGTLFLRMQLNFLGETDGLSSMNDASFDEARCVAGMRARGFMTGVANYHIYKAEIHCLYEDYAGALEHVRAQDELIASSMSLPQLVRFTIVAFLVRASLVEDLDAAERDGTLVRLRRDLAQMTRWTRSCPANFEHLRLTMEAELAGLAGEVSEALRLFEGAIAAARASEFRRDEAAANERAARLLLRLGLRKAADGYLVEAHYLYYRWGARRKVEELERAHPRLRGTTGGGPARAPSAEMLRTSTGSVDSSALDLASVMKASQTISGEILVEQLLKTTMQILLENAGGRRGFFVVREGEELFIRAQGEAGKETPPLAAPIPVQTPGGAPLLPVSIVNTVIRTHAPLVLHDASASDRFARDPYVVEHRPQSVICVPIFRHGQFDGAIYVENNLATGAFTDDRVEVMKLLSVQASISLENAKIYADQVRLTDAQRRFVPSQFLESLGHTDIARVELGEWVAREMTVLFADLRDFTPLAERIGPRATIELLNAYFSRIGVPITDAGGFIDSYNGDEIMALFGGAPERAVEAGVGMWRALEEFNRESPAAGRPALRMGVGVNTGPLVLGTVGGRDRLKCGVVGDTVNLAARIEQLTKRYGAPFLVGEDTKKALDGGARAWSLRRVDRVAVKGRAGAVDLWEVLDAETPGRRRAKEATRGRLTEGMERYYARDFAAALRLFRDALGDDPEDAVLARFADNAERFADAPPPPDWRGFEKLAEK